MSGTARPTTSIKTTQLPDGTKAHYVPIADAERVVVMDEGTSFRVSSRLVALDPGHGKEMDRWSVEVSVDGRPNRTMKSEVGFGIGHRAKVSASRQNVYGTPPTVPVEPSAAKVVAMLAQDVESAMQMPRGDAEAARYMQSEFGYEDAGEAVRVARALSKTHDDMASLVGTDRLQDVADFGRELEETPESRNGDIHLPEVVVDGERFKAVVNVKVTRIPNGTRDIDGNTVGGGAAEDGAYTLSLSGSVMTKADRPRARWSAVSSGQCNEEIERNWGDYPEVRELLQIWDRWHLSTMKAGTRRQNDYLDGRDPKPLTYDDRKAVLAEGGLLVDTEFAGGPYSYGTAWLAEPVPVEVIDRIGELRGEIPESKPDDAAPRLG